MPRIQASELPNPRKKHHENFRNILASRFGSLNNSQHSCITVSKKYQAGTALVHRNAKPFQSTIHRL